MNNAEFWKTFDCYNCFYTNDKVRKILNGHLNKEIIYYYEPSLNETQKSNLMYFTSSLFILISFDKDSLIVNYKKLKNILSLKVLKDNSILIIFPDEVIELPFLYNGQNINGFSEQRNSLIDKIKSVMEN